MKPDPDAEASRKWLEGVISDTGLNATQLARIAGLSPSTLLRALNPETPSVLGPRTRRKVEAAIEAGPVYASIRAQLNPVGHLAERDLIEVPADSDAYGSMNPNHYQRIVNTRALELAGYLPGDTVTFDMSMPPMAGDAVDAQLYSVNALTAETIFRVYDPPYLVTRSARPELQMKPVLVDNERVRIAAVAIEMQRIRKFSTDVKR